MNNDFTTETKYLFFNSSNASQGSQSLSNFVFYFNNAIAQSFFRCDSNEICYITPQSAIIANDYNEVGSTNNLMNVILPKVGGGFNTYNIKLTSGSPNILGIVADLNTQFANANLQYNGSSLTITVNFNTSFNYLTFILSSSGTPISPTSIQFDFSMLNNCGQLLGFSPIVYSYNNVSQFNSDFVPDISRYNELYIYSSCVNSNFTQSPDGSVLDNCQILFSVPVNNPTGSNIIYQNQYNQYRQPLLNNLDRIEITIRDQYGRIIGINNSSTFCFKVEKVRSEKAIETQQATRVASLIY